MTNKTAVSEAESSKNYFSFMLDLRNTGLALGDPRELPRGVTVSRVASESMGWGNSVSLSDFISYTSCGKSTSMDVDE